MNATSRVGDEKYAQLVTQYVASLPDKLATLERAMNAGRAGDSEALAEAREIAHRVRGTGGCYGLRDLSEAAAVLDDVLTLMKRGDGGTWPQAYEALTLVRAVIESATKPAA
jgi:HPt (histidine-containing phosphotransfer) domain-containing protein